MVGSQTDLVTIGRIGRPFGVKGEVKVRSLSDVPGRFDHLNAVSLLEATGRVSERVVTGVRRAGADYIMRFSGITTPEEAGALRGSLIQVSRRIPPDSSAGVFYECDLVGLTVMDQRGEELGTVEATWEFPGHHVLVVRRGRREVLIPAAKSFVTEVDLAQRRMVVQVIEGLIEDRDAL